MTIARRQIAGAGVAVLAAMLLTRVQSPLAQSGDEAAVDKAVEALRKAMLAADRAQLEALVDDKLSYGHSGGVVESKKQFVEVIASKKTTYKSITVSDATVTIAGDNAIHRHIFAAEFESDGKPGTAKIGVMQVWHKAGGNWKLLARQAFRLPT
jgi:hypothetical protein